MNFLSQAEIAKTKILVIGDAILDCYWTGEVERISPEAPVPITNIFREKFFPGGASNAAINITSLGAQATFISCIGNDKHGRILKKLLKEKNLRYLTISKENLETTRKIRLVARNQQMIRIDFNRYVDEESNSYSLKSFKEEIDNHDLVIISDYDYGGVKNAKEIIEIARSKNKKTIVDPKLKNFENYRGASIITPNIKELKNAIGDWGSEAELKKLVDNLRNKYEIESILLTRSKDGMTLFNSEGSKSIKSKVVEVSDVTGAGDSVVAVMGILLACGFSYYKSMLYANHAASIIVSRFGTSSISFKELMTFNDSK